MKYIPFTFLAGMFLLFIACNKSEAVADFHIINFEQSMETEQAMMLSEIADTLEYLELKTPKDIIVSRIWDVYLLDDFLYLHTTYGNFKFTRQGQFVTEIGRGGQGPGEYSMTHDIDIDPVREEIILLDSGKVLFYDLDGNFLRSGKWGSLGQTIAVTDSALWISTLSIHLDKYLAFAINHQGDTIAFMPNPVYGAKSLNEGFITAFFTKYNKDFYRNKGSLYLKGTVGNDTIYQLSGVNRSPYTVFHWGKYKLPLEYEAWYSEKAFIQHGPRYWGVNAASEDDRYFYLYAIRYGYEESDNQKYIIYDKEKQKGFVLKDKKEMKITDDILGGPSFWPQWVTDDYYINVIEPHDLLDEVEKGDYTLSPKLEKQLAGFDYGTNQLVILGHRKK